MSSEKTKLVPNLRFPEFLDSAAWESRKVDDLVDTITPPKKLPTATYASSGRFPIIDQSQSAICGWTDDEKALIEETFPLVIFGDHTCILKLIDHPFAQGADGIKILKTRPKIGAQYLYQFLSYRPVVTEEYKRHFSILKEKAVFFPEFKSGEQQKIADCLSSLDELIAAQARKVEALKTQKKGLMQQLFPSEDETQPRLRFPEFRDAEEWKPTKIGAIGNFYYGKSAPKWSLEESASTPCVRYGELYTKFGAVITETYSRTNIDPNNLRFSKGGEILVPRVGEKPEDFAKSCSYLPLANIAIGEMISVFETEQNPLFYTHYFRNLYRQFAAVVEGQNVKNLYYTELEPIAISCPTLDEQKRIADCLTPLDNLITAATQEFNILKTHKRGLMQQLFPSLEVVNA